MEKKCTCVGPKAFDDHHEIACDLIPDLGACLWYPHDGEIEDGGVWVDPDDLSAIVLKVKNSYIVVKREADDEEEEAA